jgi:hypothetical protein
MATAYFDCFAGAGGDMIVAALLDAGVDFDALASGLSRLPLEACRLDRRQVHRGGIAACLFSVEVDPAAAQPRRGPGDILRMIEGAGLPPRAAERARKTFTRLAEAEAKVHGIPFEEVHFHEIGAVDSIIDVVGACLAVELLEAERVLCSPIPVGTGAIQCGHGQLPVPAPATAELLVGATTRRTDHEGELTTPTAAAVLTTLSEGYGPLPEMEITAVGYGAGTREGEGLPNVLRVVVGRQTAEGEAGTVVELSANIDDCTGEILGATINKLLSAGCLDAWAVPAVMKKSRPAWVLSALCAPSDAPAAEDILFRETTTFGVRRRECSRAKLRRRLETVETPYGPIRVKVGRRGEEDVSASPEFSDCQAAAEAHHVPVREVIDAATATYRAAGR